MSTPIVPQRQPATFEFVPLTQWPQASIDRLLRDVMDAHLQSLEASCPPDPDEMTDLEQMLALRLDGEARDRCDD